MGGNFNNPVFNGQFDFQWLHVDAAAHSNHFVDFNALSYLQKAATAMGSQIFSNLIDAFVIRQSNSQRLDYQKLVIRNLVPIPYS